MDKINFHVLKKKTVCHPDNQPIIFFTVDFANLLFLGRAVTICDNTTP